MAGLLNSTYPGTPAPTPSAVLPQGVTAVNSSQVAAGTPSITNVAGAPNIAAQQKAQTPNSGVPVTAPSTATPVSAPAPTPTPTPAATSAPLATASDINADFTADFGRPAAAAGEAAYTQALAANPNMTTAQLNAMIQGGASTQDQAAEASLNGSGNLATNWSQPGLSPTGVAAGQTVWNAQTGQWENPTTTTPAPPPLPTATSQGYTAAQDTVTPQQTVAGQFANDTNANSPLMQEAATQGNEQSNARGLLNSSIGISAADQAMYNAALPMSEQDASTNAQASLANQSATNNASSFTANAANQASLANLSTATQAMLQTMQDSTTAATAQLSSTTQLALGQLSSTTQQTVQGMVNTNQQLLQTSTSAANTFNTAMNNIATIQNSTTMDAGAKQTATNTILTELQNFLNAQTSTAQAGGATSLPNLAQYFPQLSTSNFTDGTTASGSGGTSAPGTGTTPPTGAAVGSTYTWGGVTYTVGADGVGVAQSKINS